MRTETSRKRHEITQKRREMEQTMTERDHHLVAVQQDLRERNDELDALTLAETRRNGEGTLRQDEVVRQRDDNVLREQSDRSEPAQGKAASKEAKRPRKTK